MKPSWATVFEASTVRHHPLKMRVPIEAYDPDEDALGDAVCHHPLKMRVPIEAERDEFLEVTRVRP